MPFPHPGSRAPRSDITYHSITYHFLTFEITVLDEWLNILGGGPWGSRSYPASHPGMNTPQQSVVLCPIAFAASVLGGMLAGHVVSKGDKHREGGCG